MRTRLGAVLAALVIGTTLAACGLPGGGGLREGCDDSLLNHDLESRDTAPYGGATTTACADHPHDDDWFGTDGVQGLEQQITCDDGDPEGSAASLTAFADGVEVMSAECDGTESELRFPNAIAATIDIVVHHHGVGGRVQFTVNMSG